MLKTEPEAVRGILGHKDIGVMSEVVAVWLAVTHPGLTHDQDVVAKAEWIGIDGNRAKVDIGVVTWCLSGGRTVKVPFWELLDGCDCFLEGLK